MRYTSIVREVFTRLLFHAKHPAHGSVGAQPLLDGLKVRASGVWKVDGVSDLPRLTMIDLEVAEKPGAATGNITLFLSTKTKHGWVSLEDTEVGLVEWCERVLDAIDTKPSDGRPDQLLWAHNLDGSLLQSGGQPVQLLPKEFTISTRMAELTDVSLTMQIDLSFEPTLSRRASRRATPIAPTR